MKTPEQILRKYKRHVGPVLEAARDVYLAKNMREYNNISFKNQFICIALEDVRDKYRHGRVTDLDESKQIRPMVVIALKEVIAERLGEHACLEEWLEAKLKKRKPLNTMRSDVFSRLQATRVAWINSLIAEFG